MFRKLIKSLSGEGDVPKLPEIMRLTIGRAAHVDPLALQLLPEGCLMDFPSATLPIEAQGQAEMGEGVFLHRFYPDEDSVLLQVLGDDGINGQAVKEVTLFNVVDAYYPSNDSDWSAWGRRLRQPRFQMPGDGPEYDRVWFGNSTKEEDPVSLWETVHDNRDGGAGRRIFQTCMLYARAIGDFDEFLLVNMEEPEGGDRCVSLMVGMPLSENQISI